MAGIITLGLGSISSGSTSTGSGAGSTAPFDPIVQATTTTGASGLTVAVTTPVTGVVTATVGGSSTTGASSGGATTTSALDGSVTVGGATGATGVDVTLGAGVSVGVGTGGGSSSAGSDPTGGQTTDPGGVGVVVTTPVLGGVVTVGGSGATDGGQTTDPGGVGVVVTTPVLGGVVTVGGSGGTDVGGTTGSGGGSTGGGSTGGSGGGVTIGVGTGGGSTTVTTTGGGSDPTGGHTTGSGGGGAAASGTPDVQTAYVNIFRLASTSEITTDVQPQLTQLQQQVDSGAITAVQAVLKVADLAAGATAVAETSYQFFSGLTPTADGLTYLVHSPTNPTDLSDSYYTSFNLENRYINFASNLGLHSDYAPQFAQVYGSMTFQDAVATAYDRIVGDAQATAAGIDYKAAIADIVSRQPYFQEVAHERFGAENQDLSTKLAAIAYIMEEGVRADVGRYGQANQNFLFDLADGHAQHHVDLVGVYGNGGPTNLTTS